MGKDIKKRCIMIFPEFENIEVINQIREKYDPVVTNVKPHITLVFPFESTIEKEELRKWITQTLSNIKSFEVELEGVIQISNNSNLYLCLEVKKGKEEIKIISNKLYNGILENYKPEWLNHTEFIPHMTIGKFENDKELNNAYKKIGHMKERFYSKVDKVSVEIVIEDGASIREIEVNLQK